MTDNLRVLVVTGDQYGCGFFRIREPYRVLKDDPNIHVEIDHLNCRIPCTWNTQWKRTPDDPPVVAVGDVPFDVVVFQRPLDQHIVCSIPLIQAKGVAVVVELDDDFWSIHRDNVAWKYVHENQHANIHFLAQACKMADLVTVSTEPLARAIPTNRHKVRVVRNCIPESYLSVVPDPELEWEAFGGRLIVGWSGRPDTHAGDLQEMGTGLVRAVRDSGAIFYGAGSAETPFICGFESGETRATSWVELDRYAGMVAGIDVGVAPLQMSAFNEAKSYLKGMEYAAFGAPFVASPTSEYRLLASKGAGDIAKSKHHWYKMLYRLCTDDVYRKERSEQGRAVVSEMTYEKNGWRWAEAWEQAAKNRRAAM